MIVLGIDPGKDGGIALFRDDNLGTDLSWAIRMPATERDVWDVLRSYGGESGASAFIERVSTSPQMGVTSAGAFMGNYKMLRMALVAAGIPFEAILPAKWQREVGLPTLAQCGYTASDFKPAEWALPGDRKILKKKAAAAKGQASTKKKNAHKARAQELYPHMKITHATSDALLIATYGLRTLNQRNG